MWQDCCSSDCHTSMSGSGEDCCVVLPGPAKGLVFPALTVSTAKQETSLMIQYYCMNHGHRRRELSNIIVYTVVLYCLWLIYKN